MSLSRYYSIALSESLNEIAKEVESAKGKSSTAFASNHEGYAVLLEEVDELWDEIKKKNPDKQKIREEAKQVGAMALRIMIELTHK